LTAADLIYRDADKVDFQSRRADENAIEALAQRRRMIRKRRSSSSAAS